MKRISTLSMIWLLSYLSIAAVSAAMITPALPYIEHTFTLNTGTIEWIVSAFLVGYVLGQLIYGPIANMHGRLNALRWGLNINLIGLLLCLLASVNLNYPLLLIGRFITGLGSASGLACTFMLINEWLPEGQRKTAMAYSILSFALGMGLSILIGGIITQYFQWQGCFIFLAIQGLLMRIGIRAFDETLIKPRAFHILGMLRDYRHALSSLKLVTFSSIWGTYSTLCYCYSAAAPQLANHYFNLSASEYGYWNIVNIVGMLIGGTSARKLMHHFSVIQIIAIGYIGSWLTWMSLVLLLVTHSHATLWFFISTCGLFCCGAYLFVGGSYMASDAIEDKASASSMMSFINMSVATLSVVIMGYLSSNPFYGLIEILGGILFFTLLLLITYQQRPSLNRKNHST